MAERPTKVRLVRCPKCANLLQEHPDYSVYQCGGCGAVLRAKKKVLVHGGILEDSGIERDEEGFEKLEALSEKEGSSIGSASETEREIDGIESCRRKARTVAFVSSPLRKEALIVNSDRHVEEQDLGCRSGSEGEKSLKHAIDYRIRRDENDLNMNRSESVGLRKEKGIESNSAHLKSSAESLRPTRVMDQRGSDRDCLRGGNLRMSVKESKFSNFAYPDEGPSKYHLGSSSYGSSQPMKGYHSPDGPERIALLEQDRAELLWKLAELQEQLGRSGSVGGKKGERTPMDSEMALPDLYRGRDTYSSSMLPLTPDKHVANSPHFSRYGHGPASFMNIRDMDMQNLYTPLKCFPNEAIAYEDQFQQQTPRVHPCQPTQQHLHQRPHDYFAGHYREFSNEPLVPYPRESLHHRPACSCFHCYNKNSHIPPQASSTTFGDRAFSKASTDSSFSHHVNAVTHGPRIYRPQSNPTALSSQDPQPHARRPIDVDPVIDGFQQTLPGRVVTARGSRQHCHPVAGGAPFVSCYNCFELLKLPGKLKVRESKHRKLRCGACSALILLEIEKKRLIASVPAENKQILAEVDGASHVVSTESKQTLAEADCSSHEVSTENKQILADADSSHEVPTDNRQILAEADSASHEVPKDFLNPGDATYSGDFDNPEHDFQSADFKDLSEDQMLNPSKCEKRLGVASSSSISFEEAESPDSMVVRRDFSYIAEFSIKDEMPSKFKGSPCQEKCGDLSSNHAGNKCEKGNKVGLKEQENIILDENLFRESSVKDVSMATEVEVPSSEYQYTSISQDSQVSKEDQLRINKANESFLVGLYKKSFWDLSRSSQNMQNEEHDVLVNGFPIPNRIVKRAEKLAGPIQPGDYWYDVRAGFWGVTGQPCLGIIPPFIEEFNHPMPENCSSGDTSVFVNGRELHQKDLDLLSSRGLPTTMEKSYIVEISGRVFDQDTGEEIVSLGRLAPTVEKAKRGFGMKVPKKLLD